MDHFDDIQCEDYYDIQKEEPEWRTWNPSADGWPVRRIVCSNTIRFLENTKTEPKSAANSSSKES